MVDTGANITIIACSEWPANWELQPVEGMISGIGGATKSMRNKQNAIAEGSEGKLATIWPFVLTWKREDPVWTKQWPLSKAKLCALEALVEEQLAKGHITETTSPWNSPVLAEKAWKGQMGASPRPTQDQ
ncbi:hypothetical protein HGM15179_019705 [Zosterops borbonicus]|uniref:Peptidase A2 domain-containing protein n=1 Tax=Zosterops borbonicus TaxID=364589 RepID=A0A8K1D887_9PASS|nr:hypothetical protein HGM15179_019705 [Zosterops borbonicus]